MANSWRAIITILVQLSGHRIDPFLFSRPGRAESAPQIYQARVTSKFLVPLITSSFLVAVLFLALNHFEGKAAILIAAR